MYTELLLGETDQVKGEWDVGRDWLEREFSWCVKSNDSDSLGQFVVRFWIRHSKPCF